MVTENTISPTFNPDPSDPGHPPTDESRTTWRMGAVAVLLAGGLIGLYLVGLRPKSEQQAKLKAAALAIRNTPPLVIYTHPFLGAKHTTLTLPGETQGYYDTTLYARVDGYLAEWKADYGDRVKKDQVLAIVDTPELDEQILQARAELEVARADSVLEKAKLDFAKISFDRWESAAPSGAVSREERDSKKADLDTGKAAYNASLARVNLAEANLKRLEFTKGFSRVLAPYDGIVTNRLVDIGSLITAGSTTRNTPMFNISQQDRLRVFVKVPQTVMNEIKIGQAVEVAAEEFPDQVFTGRVERTANTIDPRSRTFLTEIVVGNPDLTLWAGMYVQARFVLTHDPPHLLIPANALLLRATGPQVAVIDADSRMRFRNIKIARDYGDKVEIAGGLKSDERLAVNLNIQIQEGDRVTPRKGQPAAPASQPTEE